MENDKWLLLGGGALALAGSGWLLATALSPAEPAKPSADEPESARMIATAARKAGAKDAARPPRAVERPRAKADEGPADSPSAPPKPVVLPAEDLPPRDRACLESIQAALDDEDYPKLVPLVAEAARSARADVRARAVGALRWFGKKALAQLTKFMADRDDDVRTEACDAWTAGLSEIDDAATKGALVASAMEALTDTDQLESMIMEINDLPNSKQIEILTRLIEGDNKAAADVAREHYEFVTGDPYENTASAQKWLAENPDEPQ